MLLFFKLRFILAFFVNHLTNHKLYDIISVKIGAIINEQRNKKKIKKRQ